MCILQALKYKAMDRFNRWRLFYMDFMDSRAARQPIFQYPELTAFVPSIDMCCVYLKQPAGESCQCDEKIMVGILARLLAPTSWREDFATVLPVSALSICFALTIFGKKGKNCILNLFQVIDIFLRELFGKLLGFLKTSNLQSHNVNCPSTTESSLSTASGVATSPNQFEGQLLEMLTSTPIVKQYKNISYRYEYYVNVDVFGRDGNNQRLEKNESPALMDLATIDNVEFIPTANITLKAPRRFFRLGVTEVSQILTNKKYSE